MCLYKEKSAVIIPKIEVFCLTIKIDIQRLNYLILNFKRIMKKIKCDGLGAGVKFLDFGFRLVLPDYTLYSLASAAAHFSLLLIQHRKPSDFALSLSSSKQSSKASAKRLFPLINKEPTIINNTIIFFIIHL